MAALRKGRPFAPALLLFVLTCGVYACTRSISLDDWDSINFARAIVHFDIKLQQPHPPGYPAYIFLARVLNAVVHDPQTALTLLSAVCGALCVAVFFALARDLGAGWAAFPLAALPLFWLNSEMALSDVPGLFFAVLAVWLLNRSVLASRALPSDGPGAAVAEALSPRLTLSPSWLPAWLRYAWHALTAQPILAYLVAGCGAIGFGAGVRPQDAVVPVGVLAFYVLPELRSRQAIARRELLIAGGVFAACCLVWLIPMAISLGPLPGALQPFRRQVSYVRQRDLVGGDGFSADALKYRLAEVGQNLSTYFGGPEEGGLVALGVLGAALVLLALMAGRSRWRGLALAWLLPYTLLMIAVMQPNDARKVLPVLPPMLLLLGGALVRLSRSAWPRLGLTVALAMTAVFAAKSIPLVHELDTQRTPPEQAAAIIGARYSAEDTVIFAGNSVNHLHYRLPDYATLEWDEISDDDFNQLLNSGRYRHIVVLDVLDPGEHLGPYDLVDSIDLLRDWRVLPKAAYVPMSVYERDPDASLANGDPSA